MAFLEPWWQTDLCKENSSPLTLARGARQDLGGYRALMLFPCVGARNILAATCRKRSAPSSYVCAWFLCIPIVCSCPDQKLLPPASGCAGATQSGSAV